jgi:hypothetical protein
MKSIKNKITSVKFQGKDYSTNQLLLLVLETPTEKEFNMGVMRIKQRLIDAIEKAGDGDIQLEDADFNSLRSLYETFGWLKPHKDLIALSDHLEEVSRQK